MFVRYHGFVRSRRFRLDCLARVDRTESTSDSPVCRRRTKPVTERPDCGPITGASVSYYLALAAAGAAGAGFISLASLAASFRLQGGTILLARAYATDCPRCSLM